MKLHPQRKIPGAAVSLCAVFLLATAALPVAAQEPMAVETVERTVPLPSGGTFSLANVNGLVEIEGWNREEVQISARKYAVGGQDVLRQVSIDVAPVDGGVFVQAHYPDGGAVEVRVDFRIRVPARVRLASVSTVNGSIVARDLNGCGTLTAVNGGVSVTRSAGLFSVRATNGDVSLELVSLDGGLPLENAGRRPALPRIAAETVNGSVLVALPEGAGAELDARTRNGDFSSDLPLLTRGSVAGRAVRGRVGPGGPLLLLRTVNGSIRLRMAPPLV